MSSLHLPCFSNLSFHSRNKEKQNRARNIMQKVFNEASSASKNVAKPLRFVYCDEKGKFKMDAEAFATLQLVNGPIGVVSVCGQAHQGKGFVLNQILSSCGGSQVDSSSHQLSSNGIWMWSEPVRRVALDGTDYNLLILDSEIGACDDGLGTYSTEIISLSALLSSMFIYNQMGGIDEAAIDRVSVVTEMIKHILIRASGQMNITPALGHFSPTFVWLLRDFCLDLAEGDSKITPRDYLELALMPVLSGGKDTIVKNEIREAILALFRDQECFALVRPLKGENEPQLLDQISLDKLCPEFRSGLDALIKFVFERTRPLQIGSTTMSGPVLADLTQSFIDALNNGAVPGISPSWQAFESTMKDYDIELARKLEIKKLTVKLDSAKDACQSFEKKARILEQEKTHLEQKYMSDFKRFEEVQERCKLAEKYAKSAIELADKARSRKKYLFLENGRFWFPAQVYNRKHQIGFIMSCYDAEVCYDSLTDTFQARYLPHDPRTEEGIQWDRIRSPPVDTPPHVLHVSDCRNDLYPGDFIEIQWRGSRYCPYGWWYGVIGHLETCQKNENLCFCYHSDKVVVEFIQYSPGSRWRQMTINRKGHQEEGDGIRGFYGGIRKLNCKEEISVWTSLLPKKLLQ